MEQAVIRTRFAPSPSGHLHVGGARTALFCWAYARARGGKFLLRIEDTDRKRSSDAAALAFLEDLKWLGIEWDEGPEFEGCGGGEHGPYVQSERGEVYERHLESLLAGGHAYRAFETPEELDAARAAARAGKRDYRYDRAALAMPSETVGRYLAEGRPHVVRLKVPEEPVVFQDAVRGEVVTPSDLLDDFVIRKADGFPTYHFAVVVDDEEMGVTHVIRAQEHLSNTAKHIVLQNALGFRRPVYAHLSLICNPDGSKMSKRDKDRALRQVVKERGLESAASVDAERRRWWMERKDHQLDPEMLERLAAELGVELPAIDVDDFRRAGYLSEVLMNYLALLGWSPGENIERFDKAFLLSRFDLDRLIRSPAKFDRDKLLAFNLDALQAMSADEFADRLRRHAKAYHPEFLEKLSPEAFRLLADSNRERSKTLEDAFRSCRFFVVGDDEFEYDDSKPVRKTLEGGDPNGYAHLEAVLPVLEALPNWTKRELEDTIRRHADERAEGKLGKVAQPLRIAVSGGTVSPAIFDTLAILGRDAVLARIRRCLARRPISPAPGASR